ncbi:DNA-binding transcription factor yap1 [Rhizophlyctis rosea]|uniref:DNA-binding transcription factor yap1 n=1 Tax=Rhizophlyctis rosea TaxID=64517 RepID=A0AAD5SRT8_9FUNG|nr:DNA-binding transcription factor yap1 [Rhizophlyctis rosea]
MVPVETTSSSITDKISSLASNESGSRKRPAEDVSTDEEEITKRVRALQEGSVLPSGDFYGSINSDRKKPGRKPARDDQPVDRRTAQNRAAQRAFRERKEKYVKALEGRVIELQDALKAAQVPDPLPQRQREEKLVEENRHLKEENRQLTHKLENLEQQLRLVLQSCAIAQPNLLKPMTQSAVDMGMFLHCFDPFLSHN